MKKIIILGLGPCGLGLSYRLNELGYDNWLGVEKNTLAGGLAGSFIDEYGFTWDIGGHVLFSSYPYYNNMLESNFGNMLKKVKRSAGCWQFDKFIPYPFHLNLKYLPKDVMWECLSSLIEIATTQVTKADVDTFEEWILSRFGDGIYKHFMFPYNQKVWAYHPREMGHYWVKERIANINISNVIKDLLFDEKMEEWGPNSFFQYPIKGGTGAVWRGLAEQLPQEKIKYNVEVVRIDTSNKTIFLSNGDIESYDILVSTLPITKLIEKSNLLELVPYSKNLKYSTTHAIGIGIKGVLPKTLEGKSWVYFPDGDVPFYRVTVLSNYSEYNVPGPGYYSLLCEVAESGEQPVDTETIIGDVLHGIQKTGLINTKSEVISKWYYKAPYGYPTPSIDRNDILRKIQPALMEKDIYSRGRFGAWCYEISNQDHTFMQGVELANKFVEGAEEQTWKLF